jgi:hypothetical protein
LDNLNPEYRRDNPVAVINASDVNDPEYVKAATANCLIKMSELSVEALRQAFLDPSSRVRLNSDPRPEPHTEFLAMTWEGGFLDETRLHFNSNLNVLVGGRGTGKSTLIESMRYALGLDPLGDDARKSHEGFVRNVLRPGTKVSLLIRSHRPSERCYTIERTVPNPPIIKDETGEVLAIAPRDVVPGIELFGQHEIAELTKSGQKLTLILDRFAERDPDLSGRKIQLRLELERSRSRVMDVHRELKALDERLAGLPALEETLRRFQDAGVEERLKEKSLLVREERVLDSVADRLTPVRDIYQELAAALPLDTAFASQKALEGLPNANILAEIESLMGGLSAGFQAIADELANLLANADAGLAGTRSKWDERRAVIEEAYEKLLRELQKSKIDGAEFIRMRRQIEELRAIRDKKVSWERDLATHVTHRQKLLSEWEDVKAKEYRETQRAAKTVSRKLRERVRVEVAMAGNRDPLEQLLREIGGNLSAALERLRSLEQISLPDFVLRCREGKDALVEHYGLPGGSAERISRAGLDLFMRIEELDLPATTKIELNTAADGEPPVWQSLDDLSTGQKATAVLLLLLLESEAPLVVDQPEDDLDNRFITESVVPTMKMEKRRRQFVFSTHNANIPVLGDAELILGLDASGEGSAGHARISEDHMASIDSSSVRELVEDILEGGKTAFEMRRAKYGF